MAKPSLGCVYNTPTWLNPALELSDEVDVEKRKAIALNTAAAFVESSRIDFGYAELFVDISPDPARDAFTDPPKGSVNEADRELLSFSPSERKHHAIHDLFGQHASYVTEIFDRQPRWFLFTVSVHGSRARLLRWDHAGCVVAEGFDMRRHPDILCEFIWRFSQTTDSGRGHDISVKLAVETEHEIFAGAIRKYLRLQIADHQDLEKALRQHYVPGRVYATDVLHFRFSASEENTRRFLFSRPATSATSLWFSSKTPGDMAGQKKWKEKLCVV
ncbi:uncharacterized protein BXZ73DRAFT_100462 [Epithele typhae]|uniref:uncharacterized protein n=1 Tax=Epithele typhae TaxID=378194 RepID=UPI0020084F86|nr:uncharacterized protein BXZ73DRAFT_100462 [Epithele typhae]KAH9935985.1 hypothetical protein BXZ73DRAFT_100462 [Epithele typhae]